MHTVKNIILSGSSGKPIAADVFYLNTSERKPVVIYAHGFNGFKDWGNFDLIASQFASAGFIFVKFNFSHNGTSPAQPEDFCDLDAYANNNYTKELDDLGTVLDWITDAENEFANQMNPLQIGLIGHSRGGGIVLLKAAEDVRVKTVVTWASVSECKTPWGSWPGEKMQQWKDTGVQHITNSRTNQELPLNYQLFENYASNIARLDIEAAMKRLEIPVLICHGLEDTSVSVENAYKLHEWKQGSELFLVSSDHVFGRKHPSAEPFLPEPMQAVVDKTISFLSFQS